MHIIIGRKAGLLYRFPIGLILACALFTAQPGLTNTGSPVTAETLSDGNVLSLTLERAINLALQSNRSLINSNFNLDSQALNLNSSQSRFVFQTVPRFTAGATDSQESAGAGVSFEKKFTTGARTSITPSIIRAEGDYTREASFSLSVPLLKGYGKDINLDQVASSQYSVRSARRSLFAGKVNVVVETVAAVYATVRQEELVKFYTVQAEKMKAHASSARLKEKVGLASPMDILRAEIRLKDIESSLAAANQAFLDSKDRLKLILALPLEQAVHVEAPLAYDMLDIQLGEAVRIALEKRVELEQYEDDVREAKRRSLISKNSILPQLDLVMDYDRFDTERELFKSTAFEEERWSLFLEGTMDWKRTYQKNNFEQSLISIKSTRLSYKAKKDDIVREVRRQFESLNKAGENIRIRMQQRHQAEGKLALAKIKFNYGMADNFDIVEAETEYLRASVDLLTAETEYIVGTYRMRSALGTLIERKP
jgi:outer membrane protein TolC